MWMIKTVSETCKSEESDAYIQLSGKPSTELQLFSLFFSITFFPYPSSAKSKRLAEVALNGMSIGVATGQLFNVRGQRLNSVELGRRSFTSLESLQYRAWESSVPLPHFSFKHAKKLQQRANSGGGGGGGGGGARAGAGNPGPDRRSNSSHSRRYDPTAPTQLSSANQHGNVSEGSGLDLKGQALKELYRITGDLVVTSADVSHFEKKYPPLKPLREFSV